MQPNNGHSWDDFMIEKAINGDEPAAIPIRRPKRRKQAPAATAETKAATVADLLMQAVKLAIARHGRAPREVAVREETLLEVLQAAVRRGGE